MGQINIRRDVNDLYYRYKMEPIVTKIEGKGNGIKTVVVNLSSVAASLSRPGAYVIKHFGFELGAQTNIDPRDDRWIINGSHDSAKLQEYLDGFINKFVLCGSCKNPETNILIENEKIKLDCQACGEQGFVVGASKLHSFILKNQPKKGGKKDKAARKAARKAKNQALANGGENDGENGSDGLSENGSNENDDKQSDEAGASDDEFTRRINADAQVLDASNEVKDYEWAVDMSEEAVKARQSQLPGEFRQKLTLGKAGDDEDEDGEGGGPTAYDALGDWIQEEATKQGGINKVDDVQIYVKAKELGVEAKYKTLLVLAQSLFDENILTQIPKRSGLLKQLMDGEKHERAFLGGLERFLAAQGKDHPELMKSEKIVKILHQLYDKDLVSEETITKWGSKASKKYVDISTSRKIRRGAEPFIKWLEEAEEDESSEEE